MQAEQMADLLRRVRHDFANHLQVVNGYLEIGLPDKARQYLGTVISAMGAERAVFTACDGEAALYFYEQMLKISDLGISLRYEDLGIENWKILQLHGEPYHSLAALPQTVDRPNGEAVVYLSIYEDPNGIDLFFSWTGKEESFPAIRIDKE